MFYHHAKVLQAARSLGEMTGLIETDTDNDEEEDAKKKVCTK
jgi:hypothetical protein